MYKKEWQLRIEDFVFPYGKLNPENDWIKLSKLVPWDAAEERYASQFVDNGHPAHPARMALGALIIKQRLKCSDEWVVRHVSENPYLQYFIGLKEYSDSCPFGASTMVAFRKRFGEADIAALLELSIPKEDDDNDAPSDGGTLVLDATCCPADIAYPQDLNLLNEAREKLEEIIDEVCEREGLKKPRTYRQKARKAFLKLSKSKKKTGKQIRKAIRAQLQFIRRDIGYIVNFVHNGVHLTAKQKDKMNLLTTVYEQQRLMHESGSHSIAHRIVSLAQPFVRPVPRGKAHAKTEFGAKLHMSVVDGYVRLERLDFEVFNESSDFFQIVQRYKQRHGHYPARILADRIYRNRETLAFCKEHNIRLTGPALGRPPKNKKLTKQQKKQEYQDICDRNIVEGRFGTLKTAFGLSRVAAHREDTSRCVIGIAMLVMNLCKRLRDLLRSFFSEWCGCFLGGWGVGSKYVRVIVSSFST